MAERSGMRGSQAQATRSREDEAGHNAFLIGNMEDTSRSQPISTENQRNAEQAVSECREAPGMPLGNGVAFAQDAEISLEGIREQAKNLPDLVFTTLAHRIDVGMLRSSFNQVRKSKAAGVDKITAVQYAEDLEINLYNLHQRLKRGQYVATPVKRIWLEKEDGKKRPIGIPALEDKIVQKAVETILNCIYEADFYEFSHGFRKGHSQHKALHELREQCRVRNINWILDADVSGFFDNIDHKILQEIIGKRVNDGGIRRLIGKWLKAGVMEEGRLSRPEAGTPQGGVISPLLANIFLHYVLDDWFVKEVEPRMKGRCFIIRWADDFIIGFEIEKDARRVMEVLPKRLERYGLSLNKKKTKLLPFMKPGRIDHLNPETFDFLGFTFYWGKSLRGYWVIKKQTARKRLSRFMKSLWGWCKINRHESIKEQYKILCSKLRGYYQYFGVIGNYKALEKVYWFAIKAWRFWLSRRSHKGQISWEKYEIVRKNFPLPVPRIIHNI